MSIFQVIKVIKEMFEIKTLKRSYLVKMAILGILEWLLNMYKVILLSPFYIFLLISVIMQKLGELNANFYKYAYNKLPNIKLTTMEDAKKITTELKKTLDKDNKYMVK